MSIAIRDTEVGIDLGTTFSLVTCLDDNGRLQILRNRFDELSTPSALWLRRSELLVGHAALPAERIDSEHFERNVKRAMGDALHLVLMYDQDSTIVGRGVHVPSGRDVQIRIDRSASEKRWI